MKEFNKEEFNKMCANLLSWTLKYGWYNPDMSHVHSFMAEEDLKFHSNWNWIMEVLTQITKIGWNWELIDFNGTVKEEKCFKCSIFNLEIGGNKFSFESSDSKEAVVIATWEFLNWYKTQTP